MARARGLRASLLLKPRRLLLLITGPLQRNGLRPVIPNLLARCFGLGLDLTPHTHFLKPLGAVCLHGRRVLSKSAAQKRGAAMRVERAARASRRILSSLEAI